MKNRYGHEVEYSPDTSQNVIAHLERAAKYGYRVRVFYGDTDRPDFERVHGRLPDPGKDWNEENDVTGTIGVSGGIKPIPLLIHNRNSHGGGGILTNCIVRMFVNGHEVYRHPNYHNDMDRALVVPSDIPDYAWAVAIDGTDIHARFKSHTSATRYLAFMQGKRMTK